MKLEELLRACQSITWSGMDNSPCYSCKKVEKLVAMVRVLIRECSFTYGTKKNKRSCLDREILKQLEQILKDW